MDDRPKHITVARIPAPVVDWVGAGPAILQFGFGFEITQALT